MKLFLSAIVLPVIISGSMLYGLTNALPATTRRRYSSSSSQQPQTAIRLDPGSTWGLSRLNYNKILPANGKFNENSKNWPYYLDVTRLGADSRIYILDSGVRASHNNFLGKNGKTRVEDGQIFGNATGPATTDNDGHGTYVASLAAGLYFGVAKLATIIPFKVTDNGESDTNILGEAVKAAVKDFENHKASVGVINISYKTIPLIDEKLHENIKSAIGAGMHVTIDAGNQGSDLLDNGDWIYVGATDIEDNKWQDSNYGKCVDIYAPGQDVWMASNDHDKAVVTHSGTSYAAPLVAGIIAIIGASDPALEKDPQKMKAHVLNIAAEGKVKGLKAGSSSHSRILQSPVQTKIIPGTKSSGEYKGENVEDYLKW